MIYKISTICCSLILISIHLVGAAISDECQVEIWELGNNTDLTDTGGTLNCNINLDVERSCVADFDDTEISDRYAAACSEAGGKIFEQNIHMNCDIFVDTFYNVDYYYLNHPTCVGMSCNFTNVDTWYDTVGFAEAERELRAQGARCDVVNGIDDNVASRDFNDDTLSSNAMYSFVGQAQALSAAFVLVLSLIL